jgi:hypothetical protein
MFADARLDRRPRPSTLIAACGLWFIAVMVGGWFLYCYALTPDRAGEAVRHWPAGASLRPAWTRPVLVLFLHPRCPCSSATVEELNKLLVGGSDQVESFVVFVRPEGVEPGWEQTGLWQTAAALPDVRVLPDRGGRDQKLFGARVSGEAFLYDTAGRLLFHGGITSARGHVGDNAGAEALAARMQDSDSGFCRTNVFGCRLADE